MRRGETPTNSFKLPFSPPEGTEFRIVYAQGKDYEEKILFEKTTKDCTIEGDKVTVRLEAKDTLLFDCMPKWDNGKYDTLPVKIQIGLTTRGGETLWSDIIETTPGRCLKKDGVV